MTFWYELRHRDALHIPILRKRYSRLRTVGEIRYALLGLGTTLELEPCRVHQTSKGSWHVQPVWNNGKPRRPSQEFAA